MLRKRMIAVGAAVMLTLAAGVVYAGKGAGMWGCNQNVALDSIKQFQKDTATQRDEMMIKRIELQRETAKETPDQAKVASLKAELKTLQTGIHDAGAKYGMFADCPKNQDCWENGECGMQGGGCGKGNAAQNQGGCSSCNKRGK